jgi:hypothetical protein
MKNPSVTHILSTCFAGSHFLTLQLGAHSRCASIGEFHRFKAPPETHTQTCSLCESDEACPFFTGVSAQPVEALYDTLFANVKKHSPETDTLIENSKKVRWATRFVTRDDFTQKYIHLIRDPRALLRRWMMRYTTTGARLDVRWTNARRRPAHLLRILFSRQTKVYLWKWLERNRGIRQFIQQHGLDAKTVTYHDLVTDHKNVVGGLMEWMGHDYEPIQETYWDCDHHGTIKLPDPKYRVTGNLFYDQRWKEFLSSIDQRIGYEFKPINDYLNEIGVTYLEEGGLTQATN